MLVSGEVEGNIADSYPELTSEGRSFQTQLDMFHMVLSGMGSRESVKTAVTLDKCATVLKIFGCIHMYHVISTAWLNRLFDCCWSTQLQKQLLKRASAANES
jgi:hypothetical protein